VACLRRLPLAVARVCFSSVEKKAMKTKQREPCPTFIDELFVGDPDVFSTNR